MLRPPKKKEKEKPVVDEDDDEGAEAAPVAGGADFAPTNTQLDLLQTFEREMAAVDADHQKVKKEGLAALNHSLAESSVAPLVVPLNSEAAKRE